MFFVSFVVPFLHLNYSSECHICYWFSLCLIPVEHLFTCLAFLYVLKIVVALAKELAIVLKLGVNYSSLQCFLCIFFSSATLPFSVYVVSSMGNVARIKDYFIFIYKIELHYLYFIFIYKIELHYLSNLSFYLRLLINIVLN